MTKIKICGLTAPEQARAAAEAGADFIGLIFAPSRRKVDAATASTIIKAAKDVKPDIEAVGVFVNETTETIMKTGRAAGLDRVQLSGNETPELARKVKLPVLKVVHVRPDAAPDDILREMDEEERALGDKEHLFLLDTQVRDKFGGTGESFDWYTARAVAAQFPVIIAGGLTPDNVTAAVYTLRPLGVDVSTGVETGGVKDTDKIREFIRKVREYDA
jgi:phosphoribosylanthranilate isomerase